MNRLEGKVAIVTVASGSPRTSLPWPRTSPATRRASSRARSSSPTAASPRGCTPRRGG